jgi:predicted ferric reductase
VVLYEAEGAYSTEVKPPYWIWGIVATLCCVVLTFGSGLYIRNYAYEFFLLKHIILSVILIVGCWYHAYDLYKYLGGYEDWMIAISAIWMFDRLGRFLRIAIAGPRRAKVTSLSEDYVRIDIPGIRWGSEPGKHVYIFFPTLYPLRTWENHPFSVLQTALLQPPPSHNSFDSHSQSSAGHDHDVEKTHAIKPSTKAISQHARPNIGLTLHIRKSTGATKHLAAHNNLLTLIEGPYPNNSTREVLRCDRVLLICGGIGITGLLPFVNNHWNVKLAWSAKESARCLIEDLAGALINVADKEIRVGSRLDVKLLLEEEVKAGWRRIGVVVCGPGGLCDDVRAAVIAAGKLGKSEFELEVEAYSW